MTEHDCRLPRRLKITGVVSSLADGSFAYALLAERFNGNRAKALHQFLNKEVTISITRTYKVKLPMRGFIGAGVMALTALVSFWDAVHYHNYRNPAWIGYALSGAGASENNWLSPPEQQNPSQLVAQFTSVWA